MSVRQDIKDRERFPVLAAGINAVIPLQVLAIVDEWIVSDRKEYVNVCTAHTMLECVDAPDLAAIVNASGLAVPDGMPLVWMGKLQGHVVERVYGPDLMLSVCEHGLTRGYRHFLYGADAETLARLEESLRGRFPEIALVGTHAPPFRPLSSEEKMDVQEMINAADPHFVWVGLGTPKQDYWMGEFRERVNAPVLIGIGAAFDFHAGALKQAPRWMMRCGLEWLFRFLQEPRRLWRRYLVGNPRFIFLALRQLIKRKG